MRVTRSPMNGDRSRESSAGSVLRKVKQLWSGAIEQTTVEGLELRQPRGGRMQGLEHLKGVQVTELDLNLKQKTD